MTRQRPKILIVDDEDRFRYTLARLLRVHDLLVEEAKDGYEAIEKVEQNEFDVMLLDVKMPGLDGIETLKEIRKRDKFIETIVLTGHANVDVAAELIKLGAFEYILKPCDTEELLSKIEEAYEKRMAKKRLYEKKG